MLIYFNLVKIIKSETFRRTGKDFYKIKCDKIFRDRVLEVARIRLTKRKKNLY